MGPPVGPPMALRLSLRGALAAHCCAAFRLPSRAGRFGGAGAAERGRPEGLLCNADAVHRNGSGRRRQKRGGAGAIAAGTWVAPYANRIQQNRAPGPHLAAINDDPHGGQANQGQKTAKDVFIKRIHQIAGRQNILQFHEHMNSGFASASVPPIRPAAPVAASQQPRAGQWPQAAARPPVAVGAPQVRRCQWGRSSASRGQSDLWF
jgi:hypothetical protein